MTVGDLNQEEDWGIENDFDCAVPEKDRHKAELHVAKSLMEEGDWVVARVNGGTIEGIVHKKNPKRFVVRLQIAGKFKHVTRRYRDLQEVVELY